MIYKLCLSVAISSLSIAAYAQDMSPLAQTHTFGGIETVEAALGEPVNQRAAALEELLLDESTLTTIREEFGEAGLSILRRAYAAKLFKPVWTAKGSRSLRRALDKSIEHGIYSKAIFGGNYEKLLRQRFQSRSLEKQAEADLELSLVWLRYAQALSGDLSEEAGMTYPEETPVARFNLPASLLSSAKGSSEATLASLAPDAPQYHALKDALHRYREISRKGGWLAIRSGDTIELGDTDERVPALRKRLSKEGFEVLDAYADPLERSLLSTQVIQPNGDPEDVPVDDVDSEFLMDFGTVYALKSFQKHHGLETDGILGDNTLRALNESVESKINRIAESMNRWRLQGDLGERYIWANIPSYTAEGWNEGHLEISQRTIVGKARYATPEFSDEVEYLVANPKWFLPISIVRRQKVPKLKKNPGYASKNGYHIFDRATGERVNAFDVNWSEPGVSRQYRFVQQPGDGNALGQMKIIFPNQYSIYLHGTPGKHLFDRAQRAFSSGCVRLEDPVAMAKWIARHDETADVSTIAESINEAKRTKVDLEDNLPVHITYMTVTAKIGELPYFWTDVYNRYEGDIAYTQKYEDEKYQADKEQTVMQSSQLGRDTI